VEEYKPEDRCPNCGSNNLRIYPDGTYGCNICGYTNRRED